MFICRQQGRASDRTSGLHNGVRTCRHRRRKVNAHVVGGHEALVTFRHTRRPNADAGAKQCSARTALDDIFLREEPWTNSDGVQSACHQTPSVFQPERWRPGAQRKPVDDCRSSRTSAAAEFDVNAVRCHCRRRSRRRHHVPHHVTRTGVRRRVTTIRRHCTVRIDDITSGDVTLTSATDSEPRLSCLDRAFLSNEDDHGVVKWEPNLSPIAAAPRVKRRRRRSRDQPLEQTEAKDGSSLRHAISQSLDSHLFESHPTKCVTVCYVSSSV